MTTKHRQLRGPMWGLFWGSLAVTMLCFFLTMARMYWDGQQLEESLPDLLLPPPGEEVADPTPVGPKPFPIELPFGLTHRGSLVLAVVFAGVTTMIWVRILSGGRPEDVATRTTR